MTLITPDTVTELVLFSRLTLWLWLLGRLPDGYAVVGQSATDEQQRLVPAVEPRAAGRRLDVGGGVEAALLFLQQRRQHRRARPQRHRRDGPLRRRRRHLF